MPSSHCHLVPQKHGMTQTYIYTLPAAMSRRHRYTATKSWQGNLPLLRASARFPLSAYSITIQVSSSCPVSLHNTVSTGQKHVCNRVALSSCPSCVAFLLAPDM